MFELPRSCYYAHMVRRRRMDVRRVGLRSRINELFSQSLSSAGSRSIVAMLRDENAYPRTDLAVNDCRYAGSTDSLVNLNWQPESLFLGSGLKSADIKNPVTAK